MKTSIEVNIENIEKVLDNLSTEKPMTARLLNKAIGKVLAKVKASTSKDVKTFIANDPRKASNAIRLATYKKILGGQINILDPKKASATRCRLQRSRKLDSNPNQRGGNRVERSDRTIQLDSYYGKDRAFVLRFLNSGADRTDPGSQRQRSPNRKPGNRGRIGGEAFFVNTVEKHYNSMGDEMEDRIVEEFINIMNKTK